jgi:hypothetical protein
MTTLTNKLRHNRGASITLALLFFLMCILVAGSVLAAASAAVARAAARDDEQQAYLAVSSAAEFVRDDLAKVEKLVAEKGTTDWITSSDTSDDCVLWELLSDGVATIAGGETSYNNTLTFKLDGTEVDDVKLNFTMDNTYSITCMFSIVDNPATSSNESLFYSMSLSSQAITFEVTTEEYEIYWMTPATIEKGVATT